jgi:hypothetical protein
MKMSVRIAVSHAVFPSGHEMRTARSEPLHVACRMPIARSAMRPRETHHVILKLDQPVRYCP